jgi:hypothetical protein
MKAYGGVGMSRGSVASIATAYGLDDRRIGVRVPVGSSNFTFPYRSYRLWGTPNLLFKGYRELLPRGYSGRGLKLTTHIKEIVNLLAICVAV